MPDLTRRRFAAGIGAVALVQTAVAVVLLSRSYFFAEDFTFLAVYEGTPITWDLLTTSIFGHLIPGFILLQKAFGAWFGANWLLASLVTVAVQVGGTVAFARVLLALVGRRTWWMVWLTAAFALSVVMVNTVPWWAATATIQITMAASVSAWGCALRFERTHDWRHLVSLAVMYVVALSFFEKAIVTSAYVFLFVLVVGLRDDETLAGRVRRTLAMWQVWAVIAVITLVDLVVYVRGPYLSEAGEPAGLGITAQYIVRTLPEGTFPSLVGAVYPESTIPGPDVLTVVVATVVVLGLMVWTSLRSHLALRAWAWYLGVTLLSQAVVARGRLDVFDIDIVLHNLRYQGDSVYLFLLATAVAVPAALRGAAPVVHRRALVAAAVAPLLALPLWVQSVHTISTQSPGGASRTYYQALREDDVPADAAFLDLPAPPYVVPTPMYPWNMASKVYPLVRPGTEVTYDPVGSLRLEEDGSVVPVELVDLTEPSTEPVCVQPGEPARTILSAEPSDRPVADPLLLALRYEARGRSVVNLTGVTESLATEIRGTGEVFDVRGRGELATIVAVAEWDELQVAAIQGRRVCVEAVRLATVD